MIRKTAQDFDPGVLKLFDQYVHGQIARREFLSACARITAGAAAAEAALDALSPRFAEAEQIAPADPRRPAAPAWSDTVAVAGTAAFTSDPAGPVQGFNDTNYPSVLDPASPG